MPLDLAVPLSTGLTGAVVGTAFLAGFRHGFDIDHVAAIADIASSQRNRRRAFWLATTYALGHMLVVLALGALAVLVGKAVPARLDSLAARAIGATLIVLGVYVIVSILRFRRDFRIHSRWMLVVAGVRRVLHRVRRAPEVVIEHEHEHGQQHHHHPHDHAVTAEPRRGRQVLAPSRTHTHRHRHVARMPLDPFTDYGTKTSFLIGMVHGVGAETPTQVLLFTSAAGLAGSLAGAFLVVAFVTGLFLGNCVLALIATGGVVARERMPALHLALAGATALASVYVGIAYLFDRPAILPSLLGR